MVMDAKDIQSDLRALKRLYGLLRNDGDGMSNTDCDLLDEHSRHVLKNLLDEATKRVLLKLHSEVIAGPLEESRSCEKDKYTDKDLKMNGSDITNLWKENNCVGGVSSKKRCRVCQRDTIKQLESIHFCDDDDDDDDDDVTLNSSNTFPDLQKNESDQCLWNSEQELKLNNGKSDESKFGKGGRQGGPYVSRNLNGIGVHNYDIEATSSKSNYGSKEASEAINNNKLCISTFLGGGADQQLQQLFEMNYCVPETKSAAMQKQYVDDKFMTASNLISSQGGVNPVDLPMYYWLMPPNQPCLSLSQTCKLVEQTQSMLGQSSTNNFISRGGPALENDISGESRDKCKFPTKKMEKIYGQNVKAVMDKVGSEKVKMGPDQHGTCLQHTRGISRNRHIQHQESDCTDADSCQQSSSSHDSESEECLFTDEKESSSASSGSWGGSTGSQYSSSYISSSFYSSSSSGDGAPQTTSNNSNISKSEESTPKKSGPSRIHGAYGINHKKQIGVWKRLKDRMAIIFHQHQHQHHHRNTSLGKRQGKVINLKREDEAHAAERMTKSVDREKRQQHSHFRGLVEGLLRHVGHSSKQSKSGKGKDKQHGRNMTLNKSHWRQLLQKHHTTHAKKLGLGKENARLKALPNIK